MSSINPQSEKQAERFRAPRVVFLVEQDGPPERELKSRLVELLVVQQSVSRAYLARVAYEGSPAESVALLLRAKAAPDESLLEKVGKIFTSLFGRHEHLDMMFINDVQEIELAKCCRPFFNTAS